MSAYLPFPDREVGGHGAGPQGEEKWPRREGETQHVCGYTRQNTSIHSSAKLSSPPFLFFSFVRLIRFITNLKYATRSGCHMTIITLIHWINIDNLLFTVINEHDWELGNCPYISAVTLNCWWNTSHSDKH